MKEATQPGSITDGGLQTAMEYKIEGAFLKETQILGSIKGMSPREAVAPRLKAHSV